MQGCACSSRVVHIELSIHLPQDPILVVEAPILPSSWRRPPGPKAFKARGPRLRLYDLESKEPWCFHVGSRIKLQVVGIAPRKEAP